MLSNSKAEIKRPDTWTVMRCKSFLASLRMLVAQRESFLTRRVSMGYEAGSSHPGFSSKPVTASAACLADQAIMFGLCRPRWAVEMAIYSLTGNACSPFDAEPAHDMCVRMARLRGKVVSGVGDFGFWIERLNSLYEQKTGMRLYPGTLNVQLPSEYLLPPDVIRLEAAEYGGCVSVNIVPCQSFNRRAFLLRTDQNEKGAGHHSRNIIEIATDVRLRDLYQLEDGDWVEIEVP